LPDAVDKNLIYLHLRSRYTTEHVEVKVCFNLSTVLTLKNIQSMIKSIKTNKNIIA